MTKSEYTQQVNKCASMALALSSSDKTQAKALLDSMLTMGLVSCVFRAKPAVAIDCLLWSAHPHQGDGLASPSLAECAQAAWTADVKGAIDASP